MTAARAVGDGLVWPRYSSGGEAVGSALQVGARRWHLPQYPPRVRGVTLLADGAVRVDFEPGHVRLLETADAIAP